MLDRPRKKDIFLVSIWVSRNVGDFLIYTDWPTVVVANSLLPTRRQVINRYADLSLAIVAWITSYYVYSIHIIFISVLKFRRLNHSEILQIMMTSSNGNIFPPYWPFVRGIHRSTVNSPHKGQWRPALMFSLICVWINGWVNNREAGDLKRYRAHCDCRDSSEHCRVMQNLVETMIEWLVSNTWKQETGFNLLIS